MSSSTSRPPQSRETSAEFEVLRHRGWRGAFIPPHRAFTRLHLGPRRIAETVILATVGVAGWVALLPAVGRLWTWIFLFWGKALGLRSDVLLAPQGWGTHIRFFLPCFGMAAGAASGFVWWLTSVITIVGFAATFLMSEESLPWAYMIRAFCLLQATALVYFALASAKFPHDLQGYTVSMLVFSCILIGLVPILYAFTFYLLNFSIRQKVFLTLVTMAHLILFVPHQYILHVYLLHASVLFMPVLYFVFGPFLDILAFIGFYSWGMSWRASEAFEL